jgi:hypothetical protein
MGTRSKEALDVIVPLTDSTNPYTAMMLELIADGKRYPQSDYPRRSGKAVAEGRRRGRVVALVAAAGLVLIGVAALAMRLG